MPSRPFTRSRQKCCTTQRRSTSRTTRDTLRRTLDTRSLMAGGAGKTAAGWSGRGRTRRPIAGRCRWCGSRGTSVHSTLLARVGAAARVTGQSLTQRAALCDGHMRRRLIGAMGPIAASAARHARWRGARQLGSARRPTWSWHGWSSSRWMMTPRRGCSSRLPSRLGATLTYSTGGRTARGHLGIQHSDGCPRSLRMSA